MKTAVIISFLITFVIVVCAPFWLASSYPKAIIYSLTSSVLYLLFFDLAFRLLARVLNGTPYKLQIKLPFDKIYIESHPYLPYVYKKNFILVQRAQPANYPLNKMKKYTIGEIRSNNLRHSNGATGGRDIIIPKPKGLFRINCLGASTTGNYIFDGEKGYSYPLELEEILHNRFQKNKIEVNNCGMGGYTSAEILIKFLLNSIDSNPDMIVLNHGYNDLGASLTPDFKSDYSHAKKNISESYNRLKWVSKIPNVPLALPNYIVNRYIPQNIRDGLLQAISKGSVNIESEFYGIATYRRNIENLIHICNGNSIKIVLSTYCHFLYPAIEKDKLHLKYRQGVLEENKVMRELAAKYELPLVDNFALVPNEEKFFLDSVHFTPEGMREVAKNISKPIIETLSSINQTI